jgi:DNA-binding transcriptional ArsR family regulator
MMTGDADLASVGALLAEPARARVLLALADGRELPASMLAAEAGVSASTASEHLGRLLDGGLVAVTRRGRYRYYRLAGPQVSDLIEAVSRVAPPRPVTSLREGTRANALRRARSCYDHLGGRLAVALTSAFLDRGLLAGHDGGIDLDRMVGPRPAGGVLDPAAYVLTGAGADALRGLGVEPPSNRAVRCCVDWTEQRHHMAGTVGGILLGQFLSRGWVRPGRYHRALIVTDEGRAEIAARFGVVPQP